MTSDCLMNSDTILAPALAMREAHKYLLNDPVSCQSTPLGKKLLKGGDRALFTPYFLTNLIPHLQPGTRESSRCLLNDWMCETAQISRESSATRLEDARRDSEGGAMAWNGDPGGTGVLEVGWVWRPIDPLNAMGWDKGK